MNVTIDEREHRIRAVGSFDKTNVWASGTIIKDRLFFFGMYENRDSNPRDIDTLEAWYTDSNNDFWGGKLDWRSTDNHLLEQLAFSAEDESDTTQYKYNMETATMGESVDQSFDGSGCDREHNRKQEGRDIR